MTKRSLPPPVFADSAADLDGHWVASHGRLGGVRLHDTALQDLALDFCGGSFALGVDHGRIAIDTDVYPLALDVLVTEGPNRGRFLPGIVDYTGALLVMCLDLGGHERPESFSAPAGTRRFLAVYRRQHTPERLPIVDVRAGHTRTSILGRPRVDSWLVGLVGLVGLVT